MGRFKGRAFWERAVADVEAGETPAEVARRHGVSPSGLAYWVKRIGAEKTRPAEPQLLPVRITGSIAPRRFGLVVDDLQLQFDEGTDPAYVAAIAKALRTC
ncbi:MAG: transposase [Solirubrobacteraceae bacterium]